MFKYYFIIALRYLKKNRWVTAINILGLALGISVCLGILQFYLQETTVDQYHKNTESIYRLIDAEKNSSQIDYRVSEQLLANFPEIENACFIQTIPSEIEVNNRGKAYFLENISSVNNPFFQIFSIPFLQGNPQNAFPNLNSAIITESAANMLFPNENALGKEIAVFHKATVVVSGVIEDFPENSSFQADVLVNAENDNFKFSFYCEDCSDESTHRYPFTVYVQLHKHVQPEKLQANLNEHIDQLQPYVKEASLLALKEGYLNDPTSDGRNLRGNPLLIKILSVIAIIILLLGVINFINLSVSQQANRNKQTGVRKVFGAKKKNIYYHFWAESIFTVLVAASTAIFILVFCKPLYENLFDRTFNLVTIFQPNIVLGLVLGLGILGLFVGFWPAHIFSSFNTIKVLKGNFFVSRNKNHFKHTLVIFQFSISVMLIFGLLVIYQQIDYVKHKSLGFNIEQLLRLDLPNILDADKQKLAVYKEKMLQYPSIQKVSASNGVPGFINTRMWADVEGFDKMFNIIYIDTTFINLFDLKLIEGQLPESSEFEYACLINKAGYDYLGWDNLKNKRFNNGREGGYEVVGIVENFHVNSLHNSIEPLCLMYSNSSSTNLSIKIDGNNIAQTLKQIEKEWENILPGYGLKYQFYDDWFEAQYRKEEKFAQTIGVFSILAIAISCIGLLGLAIYNAQLRIKEIGIRKVLGASIPNLLLMLSKGYMKLIALAFIISIPLANYFITEWLGKFAYKVAIQWWFFLTPGLVVLLISLLTICGQSIKAATANPVDSLRSE
ncbi:MAG: FtsX-like permease family protein [Bacteroidota bacterium]